MKGCRNWRELDWEYCKILRRRVNCCGIKEQCECDSFKWSSK